MIRVSLVLLFWMLFPNLDNFQSIFWQTKNYLVVICIFDWTAAFRYCRLMTSIQLYLKRMRRLKTHRCSPRFLFSSRACSFSRPCFWNTQAAITDQWTKSMLHGNSVTMKRLYGMTRNDRVKSKKENDRVKAEYWDVLWFFPRCKGRPHLELCWQKLFMIILFTM